MRSPCVALVCLALAACGSSSGGADGPALADGPLADANPKAPDARPTPDARPGTPDAPPGTPDASVPPYPNITLGLDPVATGLENPLVIVQPPGESRFFVAERAGRVRAIDATGHKIDPPFIDIHTQVQSGGEQGLLGLAFHPDYPNNGKVYVYFTDTTNGSIHIWQFTRAAGNPDATDGTHKEILFVDHSQAGNHNGGNMIFHKQGDNAPSYLYIGFGDGGAAYGSLGTTDKLTTRLSKMIRIDVDHGDPYSAPTDNPFYGMFNDQQDPAHAANDIWLWGLRNPWRWSFDRMTGDLWIGDVGQKCWEEIDHLAPNAGGTDLGWNAVEGKDHCLDTSDRTCPTTTCTGRAGSVQPVSEYSHAQSGGVAILGGYVYRGPAIPELNGMYFFGDNGAGFVRSFWADHPVDYAQTKSWTDLHTNGISTFGEDEKGELLLCALGDTTGACWRVVKR